MPPNDATCDAAHGDTSRASEGDDAPQVHPDALAAVTDQRERLVEKIMGLAGIDRSQAEDVVQEVTLRVLDGGVSTDVADWFHYLAEAARNTARSAHRKDATAARYAEKTPWLAGTAVPDDVAEAVVARMDLEEALAALDTLPPLAARVFILREYEQMKPREVCKELGLTPRQQEYRYDQACRHLVTLQEQRRATQAYALLALLLRPAPGRTSALSSGLAKAGALASPVSVAAAAATAVAVVVRITGVPLLHAEGLPERLLRLPSTTQTSDAAAAVSAEAHGLAASRAAARGATPPGIARGTNPPNPASVYVEACVTAICGRTAPKEKPADDKPDWQGDRYTFAAVGPLQPQADQFAVRTCQRVPNNPAMTCQEGNGPYLVEDEGEEQPPATMKKSPPAPATVGAPLGGNPA